MIQGDYNNIQHSIADKSCKLIRMRNTSLCRYSVMLKDDKNEKLGNSSPSYSTLGISTSIFSHKAFSKKLVNFIQKTKEHAIQGANPGGITAVYGAETLHIFSRTGFYPEESKKYWIKFL